MTVSPRPPQDDLDSTALPPTLFQLPHLNRSMAKKPELMFAGAPTASAYGNSVVPPSVANNPVVKEPLVLPVNQHPEHSLTTESAVESVVDQPVPVSPPETPVISTPAEKNWFKHVSENAMVLALLGLVLITGLWVMRRAQSRGVSTKIATSSDKSSDLIPSDQLVVFDNELASTDIKASKKTATNNEPSTSLTAPESFPAFAGAAESRTPATTDNLTAGTEANVVSRSMPTLASESSEIAAQPATLKNSVGTTLNTNKMDARPKETSIAESLPQLPASSIARNTREEQAVAMENLSIENSVTPNPIELQVSTPTESSSGRSPGFAGYLKSSTPNRILNWNMYLPPVPQGE